MVSIVIPARGGSKGIANKNLQMLGGDTLIGRCVKTCSAWSTIVSTDSHEIAQEAARFGAHVEWRSAENSTDEADSQSVLREVRDKLGLTGVMAFVQCTAPLLTEQDIERCILTVSNKVDMAVVCSPFHGFVMAHDEYGWQCINRSMNPVPRRQDLATQHVISGSCWAFDASYLDRPFYSGVVDVVKSERMWLDIDTPEDLEMARFVVGANAYV